MPFLHVLGAVLVAALWGGNFIAAKIGMAAFPPFFYTALRFALVAAFLLPLAPAPPKGLMGSIASAALVLCVGHMALMIESIYMGLSLSGGVIMGQLGVPFSCVLGVLFMKDHVGFWRTVGLAISFSGIVVIAGTPNVLEHPAAFMVALVGAFMWGVSNIQIKRLGDIPVVPFLAWLSLAAVPMLLVCSLLTENAQMARLADAPLSAWLAVAYAALGSTVVAYGLWSYLIRMHPVSHIAPYSLLTPLFGVTLAQMCFDEPLTLQLLIGGALTILGVAVITLRRPRLQEFGERT